LKEANDESTILHKSNLGKDEFMYNSYSEEDEEAFKNIDQIKDIRMQVQKNVKISNLDEDVIRPINSGMNKVIQCSNASSEDYTGTIVVKRRGKINFINF
jgi:hypothetical protein